MAEHFRSDGTPVEYPGAAGRVEGHCGLQAPGVHVDHSDDRPRAERPHPIPHVAPRVAPHIPPHR